MKLRSPDDIHSFFNHFGLSTDESLRVTYATTSGNFDSLRFTENSNNRIVIASAPRTGSTFLLELLIRYSGFVENNYALKGGRCFHNLTPTKMWVGRKINAFARHPITATVDNLELLQKFECKVIVITRNIYDILISLAEHLPRENLGWPFLNTDIFGSHLSSTMSNKTAIEFAANVALPWYFSHYVSWYREHKNGIVPILFTDYREIENDSIEVVAKVCKFLNIKFDARRANSILENLFEERRKFNFHRGVSGRGVSKIGERQKKIIKEYIELIDDCDFQEFGFID